MNEKPDNLKELSTTVLAKKLNKKPHNLFLQLAKAGLITQIDNNWQLTEYGMAKGGLYKKHEKSGKNYIVWPESLSIELDNTPESTDQKLLTATSIGKIFEIQSTRINLILSELGWITKYIKGWQITDIGKRLGGIQSKDKVSGIPYVRWPETIVKNRILIDSIRESRGEVSTPAEYKREDMNQDNSQFREKFEAKQRTKDGHYVRSKAEIIIDNWLYDSRITHAYERRLPIEEDQYCDFFINNVNGRGVYIEYWGFDSDPKYNSRKEKKIEIYKKYDFPLIELTDKEVSSLDDVLPRKLLEFGISIDQ